MQATQILLRQLGIHGTYKGYHYLSTALNMVLADKKNTLLYSKKIFPSVANHYQTTPSCVERNIRTVILHCWSCQGREKLQEITPYTLYKQPTVNEFIDILYWHIRFMEENM